MNAPNHAPTESPPAAKPVTQFEDYVRQHPGSALLVAAALGLAAVLVARALNPPPPPRNRAVRLLEDIQERLSELTQPAYDRVSSLAQDGAHAVSRGVDSLGDLHLDRKFDRFSRGIKSLFH